MRHRLLDNKSLTFSFGCTVSVFSIIPVVNFIVMPVAVCGATALWVAHHRNHYS
jgi:CysZ protein